MWQVARCNEVKWWLVIVYGMKNIYVADVIESYCRYTTYILHISTRTLYMLE